MTDEVARFPAKISCSHACELLIARSIKQARQEGRADVRQGRRGRDGPQAALAPNPVEKGGAAGLWGTRRPLVVSNLAGGCGEFGQINARPFNDIAAS